MPMTLAPGRMVAISAATVSVLEVLRPMMQAFAPRWTRARTWALPVEDCQGLGRLSRNSDMEEQV